MSLRVFSYGGGVQSTAALVLAAQGEIDFPTFIFANVGDDSEHPDTLAYIEAHALPFAQRHGIELVELRKVWRDGRNWTLYRELMNPDTLTAHIPVRLANGVPGVRGCTTKYKIDVMAKCLRERGCTPENPAVVGLGISLDEMRRMRTSSGFAYYTLSYPLIDLRLDRAQCEGIIRRAGLPVPPKSSCWFCPYHTQRQWRELRDRRPKLFDAACALEKRLNEKRERQGKDEVFMTDALIPLRQAIGPGVQPSLFEDDSCESGFCMT